MSKSRSTASEAIDVANGTSVCRVSAYARTISPARAGKMLFAIIPIAVDRQRAPKG